MTSFLPKLKRILPGFVWRNARDEIVQLRGVINYVSSRVEWVETDSKIHPLVYLIGETYIYICYRCPCTVYEQEVQMMRQHDIDRNVMPRLARCPFCSGPIERPKTGDKVVLQYRFSKDASSAGWWATRRDW